MKQDNCLSGICLLDLLRETLSQRKRNGQIASQIEDGKPLKEILPKPIEHDVKLDLEPMWWLERFFLKHELSFTEGVFLIYLIKVVPSMLFLPLIVNHVDSRYLDAYVSSFFGDLFIPASLILINSIHKSLVRVKKTVNENLKENRFVAPRTLINEKELKSSAALDELDKDYSNRYIKPVMLRTLQSGFNLSFDTNYQIGSGAITVAIYLFLMFLGFVVRILPETMTTVTNLGSSALTTASMCLAFYGASLDWFIVGMLAWTLFITFMCSNQVSGNPIKVRPFELIKERFSAVSTLILRTSLTVTFVVAYASPFFLLWSILPPDPVSRQGALYFTEAVLIAMMPVIVLSLLIPNFAVNKGLARTRDRLLLLKGYQLEDIKKMRESKPHKYAKIQRHLILDYKDIQMNSVWLFDLRQVLQIVGSVLLPIVTFWLSVLLR